MRKRSLLFATVFLGLTVSYVVAQRPGGARNSADGGSFVERMLSFDKDKDGRLTKAEVTDERLQRLFDRADANRDGTVTKQELSALAAREPADDRGGPGFGPPGFGPGGFGPPGGPGQVLPALLQQRLGLTAEQRAQVEALQKEVDGKLDKILDAEQRAQLKQMRQRGPGGFGPPGGGRPGGGPPPPPPGDEPR